MLGFLNRKISTPVGIIVLVSVATFVGWMIVQQYKNIIERRFEVIELKATEKQPETNP